MMDVVMGNIDAAVTGVANNKHAKMQSMFEGNISGLNAHVYDWANASQLDQFTNTTKEIVFHVATTYKNGNHVLKVIEDHSIMTTK